MKHLAILLLASSIIPTSLSEMPPEKAFWVWFQQNEDRLYHFDKDQERVFDGLEEALHRVDRHLAFEFGPIEDGKREFTISADGIREAFPKVEALYKAAPPLPRWKIYKFRQRQKPTDLTMGDTTIKHDSLSFVMQVHGSKADITVFLPGYSDSEHEKYMGFVFLFLDQALGEYDVETRVGEIDVKPSTSAPPTAHPFKNLPKEFDASLPRVN
jgi:hypothetical protein